MQDWTLDGDWTLVYRPSGGPDALSLEDAKARGYESIPSLVPGSVEDDLIRAGVLPDLYVGENIRRAWDLEYGDWWLSREFDRPEPWDPSAVHFLEFGGIDTVADIFVNGRKLGGVANMLIPHRFPVDELLPRGNSLVVHISSALRAANRVDHAPGEWDVFNHPEALSIRKAPHMFGWNIAPRLVSAGIWRSVRIVQRPSIDIQDLYLYTRSVDIREGTALLAGHYQLSPLDEIDGYELSVVGTNAASERAFEHREIVRFKAGSFEVPIKDALLWWPKSLGRPDLYEVRVTLEHHGKAVATRLETVGLRTLDVSQSSTPYPDSSFQVLVNGVAVKVLGTNWTPLDGIHSRDSGRLDGALKLLDRSNCNLVRVWGGGVYEPDEFYKWCDENGVLVWQDFALSCAAYPQDDGFLAELDREATATIKRLRNHASLAVWAGNNENDQLILAAGGDPEMDRTSRETLRRATVRWDPARSYLASAPYIPASIGDRLLGPDQHLWAFPPYFKDSEYRDSTARFIGEIGFYGSPGLDTLAYIAGGEPEIPTSSSNMWRLHETTELRQPDVTPRLPIDVLIGQAEFMFGQPLSSVADFVFASQVTQAEAFKYVIEMTRADHSHSGLVWWSLFDTWPSISASVADYSFAEKIALGYIRQSQQAICLLVGERAGWSQPVIATNDTLHAVELRFSITDLATGETVCEGSAELGPQESAEVASLPVHLHGARMLGLEWHTSSSRGSNHYLQGQPPFSLHTYRDVWWPALQRLVETHE